MLSSKACAASSHSRKAGSVADIAIDATGAASVMQELLGLVLAESGG
jgi:hypothetical protein